jgi:hypothetical protein
MSLKATKLFSILRTYRIAVEPRHKKINSIDFRRRD